MKAGKNSQELFLILQILLTVNFGETQGFICLPYQLKCYNCHKVKKICTNGNNFPFKQWI